MSHQMREISDRARQPLTVDMRLDCDLVLPHAVVHEAEAAASALARLSLHPFGTPAWQSYHTRFFERYGIGALVPVLDVVDPDVGIGLPTGYLGALGAHRAQLVSERDKTLLAMAQTAVLDGSSEVTLDETLIDELAVGDLVRAQVPPHLELCFQLYAASPHELARGVFQLAVSGASRGIGTMSGRFLGLLESSDRAEATAVLEQLPASSADAIPVQLSYPPLVSGTAHVTRAPRCLPDLISLSEYRGHDQETLSLRDLSVACDGNRLYLASLSRGRSVEPVTLNALDLKAHTPPLARFLVEVSRAQSTVVTGFDWGLASHMPFLPRVRFGRTVLSPARWLLTATGLPGPGARWSQWYSAISEWRDRRGLPGRVLLTDNDQRLPLNLDEVAHAVLLRSQLDRFGSAVLVEAPHSDALGWFGGRAHEIVLPLVAATPSRWPSVPKPTVSRVLGRRHGHLPGASNWLYVKLYGHPERQAEILADYLPGLLSEWAEAPQWWYIRYRDPEPHLRLRIALPGAEAFGGAASKVSTWYEQLRDLGLLTDLQFAAYYPESGRWGNGAALAAAELVFSADSNVLAAQFAQSPRPHHQILAAANFVAIAVGFTCSVETGMSWLLQHAKSTPIRAPQREVLRQAVRLADPTDGWAALRETSAGDATAAAWATRHQSLRAYRVLLAEAVGFSVDDVLVSLLHAHHVRAVGVDPDDERICLRLARAAALAWKARTDRSRT